MKMLEPNWEEIETLCKKLAKKIRIKRYKPEILVGISRGGLVPLRLLSDYLGIKEVAVISIVLYKGINDRLNEPKIKQKLNVDVLGKRVLIIDDVSDSGKSLILAKKHINDAGASKIRIVTLHYKPDSLLKPDYFAATTNKWINYPWEREETKRELKKKSHISAK